MIPDLSILIGVWDGASTLGRCLASLAPQVDGRVEVIVADGSRDGTTDQVARRFPWVRLLRCEPLNPGLLRREAFATSTGGLVALTEPYISFRPGWVEAALAVKETDWAVVGGPVVPCPSRIRGIGPWAAFLCEYADFLPPLTAGATRLIPGSNVVYRRELLIESDLADGLWKTWINQGLADRGEIFWVDPGRVVQHERSYRFTDFVVKRYHEGRAYGATRAQRWSFGQRLKRALTMPFVPPLLMWRVLRATAPKPRYLIPLVLSQPHLLLFDVAWVIGEAHGYVGGLNGNHA